MAEVRTQPEPRCPIRPGDPCSLCVPGASGPQDCGLVYLVMFDPDLRDRLHQIRRPRRDHVLNGGSGGGNFPICLRNGAWGSQLEGMDYYSDDYPETPLEEFLAVYERLTKYARREIHDLAQSLATGGCVAEESSPIQPN